MGITFNKRVLIMKRKKEAFRRIKIIDRKILLLNRNFQKQVNLYLKKRRILKKIIDKKIR